MSEVISGIVLTTFFLSLLSMRVPAQGLNLDPKPTLNPPLDPALKLKKQKETAYILGTREGSLMAGLNEVIYARGDWPEGVSIYDIIHRRPIKALKEAGKGGEGRQGGERIGYEHFSIAEARIIAVEGNIATLRIIRSSREIRLGDSLVPRPEGAINSRR